jgi:hypothetical protein
MDFFLSKPIRRSTIRHVVERYRLFINKEVEETKVPTTDEALERGTAPVAELRSKSNGPPGLD